MPFIKSKCPQCGKVAETANEYSIGDKTYCTLKCGHITQKTHIISEQGPETIISMDNKRLFPFQVEGVKFIEKSGGRCLVGDEMGLGKTIQALATLYLHKKDMCPFLWVGKSSLKYQYQHEIMRWMGEDELAQVIESSRDVMLPGFPGYIVSYDLLRRLTTKTGNGKDKDLVEQIQKLGVKTVVLDECQQIKNSESSRTAHTRLLAQAVPNVIALSGTPIKNHAAEYFPILNILNPQMFPRESTFVQYECDSYWTGYGYKTGGLRFPERFKAKTSNFIIRRERAEVMPDLPKIQRQFQLHEMGKEVERAYDEALKMFCHEYDLATANGNSSMGSFEESSNILAYLSRMRHLVGLAKIDPCIDNVMEFLGSTERKLTVFHHHKDVGHMLASKLNEVLAALELEPVLHLTADLNAEQRYDMVTKFTQDPKSRVLLASTLASGEGLNLQVCSDCIMLERQWNPANEEQAEARFPRPGSTAQSISAIYLVAVGTVDEFFSEIVERKREIVANTLGGEAVEWDQSSIMKELTAVLAASGSKRWTV